MFDPVGCPTVKKLVQATAQLSAKTNNKPGTYHLGLDHGHIAENVLNFYVGSCESPGDIRVYRMRGFGWPHSLRGQERARVGCKGLDLSRSLRRL